MKKLKWWMELMLAGCTWMLAGASAAVPQPRASETSGGVTWSYVLQGETAVLMGANPVEGTLTIPSTLGGYPVTTIANKAFYQCAELTGVAIPEGVTGILDSAFDACMGLTSVTFPSTLTSIGARAFFDCCSLKAVDFPAAVTNIDADAFGYCSSLEQVSIPEGVETIWGVFRYCTNLVSVTLPESVRVIRHYSFEMCTRLASITFPDGIEEICNGAFSGCSSLTSVTIPPTVTTISDAFWECRGLTNAVILGSGTQLDWAFSGCTGMEKIYVPVAWEGTTKLENSGVSSWTTAIYGEPGKELAVFAANGGTCATSSQSYDLGKAYGTLPEAARTHYAFDGWWTAASGGTRVTAASLASVEGKRTLYAHWALAEQVVTCRANGGVIVSGGTSSSTWSGTFAADQAYGTLPEAEWAHHAFDGWYTAAEGGERVEAGDVVAGSDTLTLYAHWHLSEQVVTFNANGGSCATASRTYEIGGTYSPLPEATRERYTFAGWWTSASGGERVEATAAVTETEWRTLYAHWTPINQTVSFYANGGSCDTASATYAVGEAYGSLPVPVWEHHAFEGWWTSSGGGEKVEASSMVTPVETRALYAHWRLGEQVVTFNPNGGSCATVSRLYEVGGTYGALPVPVREHYAFAGWWTSSSGGTLVTAETDVSASETRTLYAHWTVAEQVVTFDATGGSCATATRTFEVGQAYAPLPMASRGEYTFAGWWTSASGGERVDGTTVVTATETRTLYAHWTPNNQVVTFNANGGSCAVDSRTYAVGKPYGELPAAERVHWTFAGWYASTWGDGEPVTEDSEVTPAETRTLYARWTLAEQVVSFDANGGVCAATGRVYAADGTYSPLPEATREGYAFAGWWSAAEGGTAVAEADMVSGGDTRTLHAHWTLAEQVVTFFENGGTCATATRTYAVGSPYGWLPAAERAGVDFAGWHEWNGGTWERVTEESVVTEERTRWLCALWKDSGVLPPTVEEYGADPDGGGYMVRFTGAAGKTYILQRTPNLGAGNAWSTVETLEADRDGPYQMAALRPSSWPQGFYRVLEAADGDQWLESYLVVDMEGGPSAACWPVSVVSGAPDGGWSDEYKTTKLVLHLLAPDTFTMGSPYGELGREDGYYSYSGPETQHGVTLAEPFHIGVFEVTQKQWELATGNSPSFFAGATRPVETVGYADIRGSSSGAAWPGSDAVDSGSFLGVLRARTGLQFDLPTEAEWEYACRAGTATALNSGKDLAGTGSCTNLAALGRYWYNRSEEVGGWAQHTAVGSYQPNAWGLYDMHGNVAEWCRDWYSSSVDSASVTNPVSPASGSYRANRGGSWTNSAQYCRSASRSGASPSERRAYRGLRVACPGVETYRVRFEANGGSGEMEGQRYVVGNDRLLPENAFVRAGYSFAGWANSATGEVAAAAGSGAAGLNASAGDNVTLYAAWRPNAYGVRFDANDGTGTMASQAFTYTVPQALTSNAFTRTGYVYKGWATNAGGDVVYADGATVLNLTDEANGVVPLYAVWEPISYRIRFGANGGDGLMEDQVCFWDAPVELYSNAFTRPDYGFAGWATNASGDVLYGDMQLVSNLTSTAGAVVPLYAQWYSYMVRFDANGGEGAMENQRFLSGIAQPLRPNAFNRMGYAFMGWATSPDGAVEYADGASVSNMMTSVGGVVTLYAKWRQAQYLVVDMTGGQGWSSTWLPDVPEGGWTDEYKTSKLVLRAIPAGTFIMGDSNGVQHTVTLTKAFYLGVFEVTQEQWKLVMRSAPSYDQGDARPVEQVSYDMIRGMGVGTNWPTDGQVDEGSFLGVLRAKTGLEFDLPTEAQWEYACRAGTTTDLNSGKDLTGPNECSNMAEVGRYYFNQSDGKGGYTSGHTTVGSYLPNAWGLYDMHGNVWEWCLDWYADSDDLEEDAVDPIGCASGSCRVLRGGGWDSVARFCRSAFRRDGGSPSGWFYSIGFRLACSATQ